MRETESRAWNIPMNRGRAVLILAAILSAPLCAARGQTPSFLQTPTYPGGGGGVAAADPDRNLDLVAGQSSAIVPPIVKDTPVVNVPSSLPSGTGAILDRYGKLPLSFGPSRERARSHAQAPAIPSGPLFLPAVMYASAV